MFFFGIAEHHLQRYSKETRKKKETTRCKEQLC